jgi:non-specific serine/threonine protein kinase
VLVETLLRACPHLEVMLTSREPVRVIGETIWQTPPLSPPDATYLFVERARQNQPPIDLTAANEAAIDEICRRLDGIPLAIELAAARVRALSIEQIAQRLDDRFRLLTTGSRTALPRQQTLRGTLDWSYDLLTAVEQAMLRRLSVFAGGFMLDAAEAVCGAVGSGQWATESASPSPTTAPTALDHDVLDTLTYLVDKSLVIAHQRAGAVRYGLLETVRRYAAEKLEAAGEALAARRRHRGWYIALAEQAEPELLGPGQAVWIARLEEEHDNLRAALAWSLTGVPGPSLGPGVSGVESPQVGAKATRVGGVTTLPNPKQAEAALRLAGALTRFWERHGHLTEGRQWLAQALAAAEDAPSEARAKALHSSGVLAGLQGDYAAAQTFYESSLNLYRDLNHARGVAEAQGNLGRMIFRQGDYATARTLLEASLLLHRDAGYQLGVTSVQGTLGELALRQGNFAEAQALFEAKLTHQRKLGNTEGIADALEDLASVAGEQGDDERQSVLLEEALVLFRELGSRGGVALVLGNLGIAAWTRGDPERARALLEESLALYRQVDDRRGIARLLANLSFLALHQRDHTRATALGRESLALYRELGDPWGVGRYLPVLAGAAFAQGQIERAARLFGAAAGLRERLGTPLPPVVQPTHDRAVTAVRASLGESDFTAAWSAGSALTPNEAVAEALHVSSDCGSTIGPVPC